MSLSDVTSSVSKKGAASDIGYEFISSERRKRKNLGKFERSQYNTDVLNLPTLVHALCS